MQAILTDLTDPANAFAHLSYIFLIASMMMTSLKRLRLLALLSGLAAMSHFLFRTQDNASLVWETIFTLTNGFQLAMLVYHSRGLKLRTEEAALVEQALGFTDISDQRQLLSLVTWRAVQVGAVLMEQGTRNPPLVFVAEGAAAIEHDGKLVGVCGPGDFLGEMSLVSGEPASATVRATNPMRIGVFEQAELDLYLAGSNKARDALATAFNRGLAAKVLRMNRSSVGAAN